MPRLTEMSITRVSLVDKGANQRRFAILKRDATGGRAAIRKDVPTFAQRQATAELQAWLPSALYTLGDVIDAALRPPSAAAAGEPTVTGDQRLMAVAISCDEFKAELVTRVGQALSSVLEADAAAVVKRGPAVTKSNPLARLRGLL